MCVMYNLERQRNCILQFREALYLYSIVWGSILCEIYIIEKRSICILEYSVAFCFTVQY